MTPVAAESNEQQKKNRKRVSWIPPGASQAQPPPAKRLNTTAPSLPRAGDATGGRIPPTTPSDMARYEQWMLEASLGKTYIFLFNPGVLHFAGPGGYFVFGWLWLVFLWAGSSSRLPQIEDSEGTSGTPGTGKCLIGTGEHPVTTAPLNLRRRKSPNCSHNQGEERGRRLQSHLVGRRRLNFRSPLRPGTSYSRLLEVFTPLSHPSPAQTRASD